MDRGRRGWLCLGLRLQLWLPSHVKEGVVSLTTVVLPTPPLRSAFAREVVAQANVTVLVILHDSSPLLDSQSLKLLAGVEGMSMRGAELAFSLALICEAVLICEFIVLLSLLRLLELLCLLMSFFLVGSLLFLVKIILPHSFIILLAYFFLLDVLFRHEGSVEGGFEGRPLGAEAL